MDVPDEVVRNAQATVEAIDRKLAALGAAREALVELFELGVRTTPAQCPKTPHASPPAPETALPPGSALRSPPGAVTAKNGACTGGQHTRQRALWESKRQGVLQALKAGGPTLRRNLINQFDIAPRQVRLVLQHPWFETDEKRMVSLTEEGALAAEGAGDGS